MVEQEKSAIDLETGKKHGRQNAEFEVGDLVYMFFATIKLNLSNFYGIAMVGDFFEAQLR